MQVVVISDWLRKVKNLPATEIRGAIEAETDKAILINNVWIPKSQIIHSENSGSNLSESPDTPQLLDNLPDIPIFHTTPWAHQTKAFWFTALAWGLTLDNLTLGERKTGGGAGLFVTMGGGKSKVTIDLKRNFACNRTLIQAPKTVVSVWPDQFDRHWPGGATVLPLTDGSVKKKQQLAQEAWSKCDPMSPLAIVINYESAWREPFRSWSLERTWDLLVCDEVHKIKADRGKSSMYCKELSTRGVHRLGLTGTPMPHSPLDVFAQYRFLNANVFGSSFPRFRSRYAVMGGFERRQVMGWRYQDEMKKKIYSIAYRVPSDVLDLPEVIDMERRFALPKATQRIYASLESRLVTEVKEGTVTVRNALVKFLRLQQLTGGHLTDDDGVSKKVESSKPSALHEVLEEIPEDESVVVVSRFHGDMDSIHEVCSAVGRTTGELSGRVNQLKEWQDGESNTLVLQEQTGGMGIDLTRTHYVVFYSLTFSLGDYQQVRARFHRPGQKKNVRFIHLVAEKTVDQKVLSALRAKEDVIRGLMTSMKEEA
jgi:SNF2 family DNA or RNA helicase